MPNSESIFRLVTSGNLERLKDHVSMDRNTLFMSDRNGQTALHIAATEGLLDEASYLIESGCFVHVYDRAGRIPFHCAVKNNQQDMATYLLEMGTFPHMNTRSEDTALHISVENSLMEMSSWLMSLGSNLHYKNRDGDSPLHKAAYRGNVPILKNMTKFSPNLEIMNNAGDTPFLKAAMWGHISAVQFLFDAGANIHHINFKGDSALHLAALGGSISVVKWLLLQGVSISSENLSGNTAQDVARTNRIKELIRNVYNNGLGVIYNKGKDSNDEIKAQQEEESKVKILLREEIKEEMNMNARLLLEKELKLLNGEQGSQLSVKNAPNANSQTSAGQWSSYNGELVGDDIEEEKDFEIEELSVLGNLMSRRRPHIETNGAPGGMIPAPSSCASGVTDTAGTTIAGHRSDDTLSDDTELNDSMFSQNTSDYWNERANHYLSRMKNFAKKVEEYSSSDEDSVISEPATEKKHIPVKGKIEEFVTGAVFGMSDDEEYEQDDQDDLLSIDPRVDANNDDSSDDDDIFQQDQELSMMAQAGVVSDMEIETMNEDGSGVSDATLEGSSTDGNDEDEEQMSLERLIELQEQELAALMTEQHQMLVDLQRSQQDEVDTELSALIDSAEISELDDDGQELKVNEVRGLLTEKHGSQLRQLWNDHQTTLNAMRDTHKFERMSFSFEYGNNEGKEGEAVEVTTEDAIIKQEQISMLEENIEVLRALLRESGVSPGGVLTSPSGIVSVKEQEVEEVSNEAICEFEEASNEVEVEEASNEVTFEAVDKDEQNQDMVHITAQSSSEQIIMDDLDETEQRKSRKSDNRDRLSSSKKRDSRDRSSNKMRLSKSPMTGKSGVKLLQTGKLAAGLGRSALQSLLGDESDSDSGDDDTSDITASSSEYYSSDDEEQSLRMRVQSNNDVINAPSKRTLSDDLAAEEYSPPTPVEEPLEIQEASPVKLMPIVEAPIQTKEKEDLNLESVVDKPIVTASPAPPTEGVQKKTPTTASPNKFRPSLRLSTGSRRSTGTAKSDQRLMASGQLAAGLGNTIMRSFMCDSDSDLSTQEDDNSSRSSSLSSGSWGGSQDGGSVSRDSEDEKEASNGVEEPEIKLEPDFSDVTTSPDALKCETRAPPPTKMVMSSQHAPVDNDSCPYEVKTVYDLSPVRMASPSPTESPTKERKIAHSDEEQAKISMLEANIVALRALLRDSGVSPRDFLANSSNKQKEDRDVEEETDLITTTADDMSEDEKQRQRQQEVEDESRRVFDLIDLNKDGVVTKIELIKGLKSNCLNLPEVLNLPAHIRQEDGSRDNFMSVFHSMDKNNSSDISLSEFVEFCHNVRAHSSSNILPMIKESNGSESDQEEDADVSALKEAAGQAMQSTVDMLKKVMEDSDLFPTPDKVNVPAISSPKRPSTPDSVGDSRPGSNISPARSRVLTPMPSIGADVDQLSSFKTLATKLNILASYLLTESRASSLRDISDQINNMISEIEDDGDDDLEWGGVIGEEDKVAQLTVSCRKWKVDALSIVRGEIHALEERVSQIYTVFLE